MLRTLAADDIAGIRAYHLFRLLKDIRALLHK
jgi:hypothetical protein